MIDKEMMEEVLRWMVDRDSDHENAEQAAEQIEEAGIDVDALNYYMTRVPEDIMRQSSKTRPKGEDPVLTIQVALASTFNIAFEAGVRCKALDMERNG
jgi:membrane-bound lytic murein transglycosylase